MGVAVPQVAGARLVRQPAKLPIGQHMAPPQGQQAAVHFQVKSVLRPVPFGRFSALWDGLTGIARSLRRLGPTPLLRAVQDQVGVGQDVRHVGAFSVDEVQAASGAFRCRDVPLFRQRPQRLGSVRCGHTHQVIAEPQSGQHLMLCRQPDSPLQLVAIQLRRQNGVIAGDAKGPQGFLSPGVGAVGAVLRQEQPREGVGQAHLPLGLLCRLAEQVAGEVRPAADAAGEDVGGGLLALPHRLIGHGQLEAQGGLLHRHMKAEAGLEDDACSGAAAASLIDRMDAVGRPLDTLGIPTDGEYPILRIAIELAQ